jgi:hypothetical protein
MSVGELRVRQRRGTIALAGRETRRVFGLWTQTILPPVFAAGLFLAIFGGALGRSLRHVEGLRYVSFILPGVLVMTVAAQSFANCSTSLFQAKDDGYIEDVLSSPLRPWQLALSYLSGGILRRARRHGCCIAGLAVRDRAAARRIDERVRELEEVRQRIRAVRAQRPDVLAGKADDELTGDDPRKSA